MSWFKIDDKFHSHPKVLAAGLAAMGLWVRAGSYTRAHRLDGFVPTSWIKSMGFVSHAKRLVDVGLWDAEAGGYRFHDFTEYNESGDVEYRRRSAAAAKKRRQRHAAVPPDVPGDVPGDM